MGAEEKQMMQWHPAFFAGLQIELQEEAEHLIFENEHQLGTKPKEIDVLVIKKKKDYPIHKNIGRIFRKHNIVEYKGPTDYLSIDDFYKVYGYACFYKSDVRAVDSIPIDEITITFVCSRYPEKLIRHLDGQNYKISQKEAGIYYITGDRLPIQLILTPQLSEKENLWLRSLTNHLREVETAERLIKEYGRHKENGLYQSLMNMIVRANQETFQEVRVMCEALEELMKDEIDAKVEVALQRGIERGIERGRIRGIEEGIAKGRTEERERGIQAFILDNLEEQIPKERILAKLEKRFELDAKQAEEYYERYSKQ